MAIRKYTGRVEFFAVRKDFEKLFEQGYSLIMAYELFKAQKRLTISYSSFCSYARRRQGSQIEVMSSSSPSPLIGDRSGETTNAFNRPAKTIKELIG